MNSVRLRAVKSSLPGMLPLVRACAAGVGSRSLGGVGGGEVPAGGQGVGEGLDGGVGLFGAR